MPVFELRIYHAHPGRLDALTARFALHTDALIKRHGMNIVAYWMPRGENPKNILMYMVEHESEASAKANWAAFMADPVWQRVRAESEEDGAIVASIDSYYMDQLDLATNR